SHLKRRACWRKWIARVQTLVAEIVERAAAQLVGPWFREDLDLTKPDAAVFGVERILVNAHFANGFFRGHAAAGETVDKDLSTVWPSGRSGHGLHRRCERVRIVRQYIEILTF